MNLRSLLAADHVTQVPGVYDPASAALAVRAGHQAAYLSWAAVAATMLGRPGLDLTPATQIADRAALLGRALGGVPLLADGDVGFDSPDDAGWSALAYERSGISGVVLGDGEDVRPSAARITAMVAQAPGVTLIAQAAGPGLAETIERARAYVAAGADAILPSGVHDPADLDRIRQAVPGVPLVVSRSEADAAGPRLSDAQLAEVGVRLVLHPLAAVLAALRAASLAYRAIAEEGSAAQVDRMPMAAFETLTSPWTPARRQPPAPEPVTALASGQPEAAPSLEESIARIDT
jgi:2-methylisocitrate lyase-like PEP mutase family enzyme